MTTATAHYERLFQKLVREHGPLYSETLTSIVGFSAGGPVAVRQVGDGLVTVELSLYKGQRLSAEGVNFELFSRLELSQDTNRAVLSALGSLSMTSTLGHGHTIDLTYVATESPVTQVALRLHSKTGLLWSRYGVYEVVAAPS